MEMIPVTLIVKAPNQQIEDQTVKCELSWTIHKLKSHLSEVYPSKPPKDEQKLIYSGQLLSDTVVLKDVLRNYDGQNTHTVHLVCSQPRYYKYEPPIPVAAAMDQTVQPPAAPQPVEEASSSSGLRQRTHSTNTDFRTMWTSLAQPYGAQIPDPAQYAVQAALFQQAYVQYINQYMQMVTNQHPTRTHDTQTEEAQNGAAPLVEPPADAPVADDADLDEAQQDRDWLDWFYVLSRVLVLFCIVYFYSSPLRFAFVLLLGIGLYLYQIGFFRANAHNNNEMRRPENNNVAAEQVVETIVVEQRPTMLNIMWTFFTTFFTSLIPEIPNAV